MHNPAFDKARAQTLRGFYENELTNNILYFWDDRCVDDVYGGFFNCYDNRGERLISHDKYTWSQGRFVWLWAKLADMQGSTFSQAQRKVFSRRAVDGTAFIMRHCLLGPEDWRCAFLLDRGGTPKPVPAWGDRLDLSIYADGFAVLGLARSARLTGDKRTYAFAKKLFLSMRDRQKSGDFLTAPYPIKPGCRAHGLPMGQIHIANEMLYAACAFDDAWADEVTAMLKANVDEVLNDFVDDDGRLREFIAADGSQLTTLLGQHMNPGHIIEDVWFLLDAAETLHESAYVPRITAIAKQALALGWDDEFGGLLHFCGMNGGQPTHPVGEDADEPMTRLVQRSWGDKLWWVHSEALYATLRLYASTQDDWFLAWHDKLFDYTFDKHPNPNREVREWIQILDRQGNPDDKVVALPVKDPYHIVRNLALIIELLSAR